MNIERLKIKSKHSNQFNRLKCDYEKFKSKI